MREEIKFFTDTAEVCVFDPDCLKHRLSDAADWWTVPTQALKEMNAGNVMFVDVGSDGGYILDVHSGPPEGASGDEVESVVNCPTGQLFIGPAEETTGEGCEPDPELGGKFFELSPGAYRVRVAERGPFLLEVSLQQVTEAAQNRHTELLRLFR